MNIDIDWQEVSEVRPILENDNMNSIIILFKDKSYCVYTYKDCDDFIKDYVELMGEGRG